MSSRWKCCSHGAGSTLLCAGWSTPCRDKPARVAVLLLQLGEQGAGSSLPSSCEKYLFTSQEAVRGNDCKCFLSGFPSCTLPAQGRVIPAPSRRICSMIHLPERRLAGSSIEKGLCFSFYSQWEFHQIKRSLFFLSQSVGISPGCHNSSSMVDSYVANPSRLPQDQQIPLIISHEPVHPQFP